MRSLLTGIALAVVCTCLPGKKLSAQKIIVSFEKNTAQVIDLTTGTCTSNEWTNFCLDNGPVTSMALIHDTIYFLGGGILYQRAFLNAATTCRKYVTGLRSDVLTVDKKGMVYCVEDSRLIRINPYLNILDTLGILPFAATGDMIFYKEKLYMSTTGGIVEVNTADPSQSRMVIVAPGREFPGLINVNAGCSGNKVYAIEFVNGSNNIIELDLEQHRFLGVLCSFNVDGQKVLDAGSFYETGEPPGITVRDMTVKTSCWPDTVKTEVVVIANTPTGDSGLLYTLVKGPATIADTPYRGPLVMYHKLAPGIWNLNIRSKNGCALDTLFTIPEPVKMEWRVVDNIPDTCNTGRGSFTAKVSGGTLPYDNGRGEIVSETTVGTETTWVHKSSGGNHGGFRVYDKNRCSVYVEHRTDSYTPPIPLTDLTIIPATGCQPNGEIKLTVNPASPVKVSAIGMDGGNFGNVITHITGLAAGTHVLKMRAAGCTWDTSFIVPVDPGSAPVIRFNNKNLDCQSGKNSTTVQVSGIVTPFTVSFNGGAFTPETQFNDLTVGIFPVVLRDGNGCEWKASDTILPYIPSVPVIDSVVNENRCLGTGNIRLAITGAEAPYRFQVDGGMYNSGMRSVDLAAGTYPTIIYNATRCAVDTVQFTIREKGDCDTIRAIYVPSAFTPNGDGKNDMLEPLGNPIGKVTHFVFRVYNRSGQVVFESRSPGKGWDGKYKGIQQPPAVYVWVFAGTDSDGKPVNFKGTTLLLR
jgi:gliding motility-associated-like protein